jgi:hypothetical protein
LSHHQDQRRSVIEQAEPGSLENLPTSLTEARFVLKQPSLGTFRIRVNALGIEQRRKRPGLEIHGAGRQNRRSDRTLDRETVELVAGEIANSSAVAEDIHEFHKGSL